MPINSARSVSSTASNESEKAFPRKIPCKDCGEKYQYN